MKKILIVIVFCTTATIAFAQSNTDSAAYELQRNKINQMLDVRARKFGIYDQSLSQHTGIFGLQTKKDIRRSNEILMDIAKADNEIFRQTKILLDFRAFQQTQAVEKSKEAEGTSLAMMYTIKRLQDQVQKLNHTAAQHEREADKVERNLIVTIVILILIFTVLIYFAYRIVKVQTAKTPDNFSRREV